MWSSEWIGFKYLLVEYLICNYLIVCVFFIGDVEDVNVDAVVVVDDEV